MEKITGNEPSYSLLEGLSKNESVIPGLTIRQQFAAMAMQGLFAGLYSVPDLTGWDIDMIAKDSVKAADALIAELNK